MWVTKGKVGFDLWYQLTGHYTKNFGVDFVNFIIDFSTDNFHTLTKNIGKEIHIFAIHNLKNKC